MIEVVRYTADKKDEWDSFVRDAENSFFFYYRTFIEYHKERFTDLSLLLYDNNKVKAIIPGNIVDNSFYSHQGLTFGGYIVGNKVSYSQTVQYYIEFTKYLHHLGIKNLTYKIPPFFYSKNQQQAINHILLDANYKIQQNIGAMVYTINHNFPKKCVRKGKLASYQSQFADDLLSFWDILSANLKQYHSAKPVHSYSEISYLKDNFPNNIKLLELRSKDTKELHAGALLFVDKGITKVQYFATSTEGRQNRASDVLYYQIIQYAKENSQYIDFGSNLNPDGTMNNSLIETKEKFGAKIYPLYSFYYEGN